MPPLRFDAKTVLAMFNQSRLAADEAAQKERLAAINQSLEETKMADERQYRQDTVEELKRQHDQAASWHADEVARQTAADKLTADWHAAAVERERLRDQATDKYNQGMLGYYNRMADIAENKQLGADGKPLTESQMKAQKMEADMQLKKGLAADLSKAMGGLNLNTSPSEAFGKGAQATHDEMSRSLSAYSNILDVLQKYDLQGYPASILNQGLIKRINDRLSKSDDWLKTIHQVKEDPNISPSDATGIYPGTNAIGISERVPVIPQEKKDALFNQWVDVNTRLSQYDPSAMSGFVLDPLSNRYVRIH